MSLIPVSRAGSLLGHLDAQIIREFIAQGALAQTDHYWDEREQRWMPLSDLTGISKGGGREQTVLHHFHGPTDREQAFLNYLKVELSPNATALEAAKAIDAAIEDPANQAALEAWFLAKFELFPEIYTQLDSATELQRRHEEHKAEAAKARLAVASTRQEMLLPGADRVALKQRLLTQLSALRQAYIGFGAH